MDQVFINICIFIFMAFAISLASLFLVLHLEREDMLPRLEFFTRKDLDDE